MINRWITTVLLACVAMTATVVARGQETSAQADPYAIIVENNIFKRDRTPPRTHTNGPTRPVERPVYKVERDLVLTGIGRRGEVFTAFIEDLRSGATNRLTVGEKVGEGTLTEIALDHVVYRAGEQTTRVEVGMSLAGTGGSTSGSTSSTGTSSGSGTSTPSTGLDPDDEKSILERLRQQRLKELNGK